MARYRIGEPSLTIWQKLWNINWVFVLMITLTSCIGFAMLYSAAGGNMDPWASRQMTRFAMGFVIMLSVALVDIRIWLRYAYFIYIGGLAMLIGVEVAGTIGMGAQRWINLGVITVQPSEVMKIAMVLALARYFHSTRTEDVYNPFRLVVPLLLVAMPAALVLRQPDLGTALMLVLGSGAIFFAAGVKMWKFGVVLALAIAALPVGWQFLRAYQRQRVLTFLNPEQDPLGSGYHIIQSKIALGSGGVFGKGFMQGTQSHLSFLPEMQTDFIFTMLAEELGMVGAFALITFYLIILIYGFVISVSCRNQFGRLVAIGITTTFFLYVFINIAMVTGLIPVVGVPLPLISYGGTAMLTLLIGFGLLIGTHINREAMIGRRSVTIDAS
ncbi:MAG: rod shape-determining protein RodA [Rhodospirillales bacterium]|jgi:rod shape determining protein RodA|nr:rod shape-determining protein RodA [Rhodospirillales bacterium]MBT5351047.1 rod shape-determining protein RodA [Rhodospirillales bacterium]MBT5521449.1 rod shape-determining protein RodA [Rhodospirillales bacterium]MBT6109721.1 rod shape-determining protein RodA [Rhodospirillales bacterium]MBT6825493.1 rod shape-determining protein RodA [Rhodospirillales bacterium]